MDFRKGSLENMVKCDQYMKPIYPEHHMIKNGHIDKCQVCNSNKLNLVLDLGHQPLCDTL